MTKLPERLRWRIATVLNKLPNQCWANLVSWALGDRGYRPWQPIDSVCRKDVARQGACYCGKLRAPRNIRAFNMAGDEVEPGPVTLAAAHALAGACRHGVGMLDQCNACCPPTQGVPPLQAGSVTDG